MTDLNRFPPDRSWEFGLLCHYLLVASHSLLGLTVLHLALLLAITFWALRLTLPSASPAACAVIASLGICADPLLETYARFQLSDLSAALAFLGFVLAASPAVAPPQGAGPGRRALAILAASVLGIAAVLLRVAYLPVEAGTLLIFAPCAWRAGRGRWALSAVAALLIPLAALAATLEANHLAFRGEYRNSFFTNRLSGIFLAGVFAPALRAEDFRRAGIDVGDGEVAAMRLGNYDDRIAQVWGAEPFWMRSVIDRRLHATGEYDENVDRAAHRMVAAAFRRDPAGIGLVYLRGLLLFARPAEWRRHVQGEMGAGHAFAPGTVAFLDAHSARKVLPSDPSASSRLTRILCRVVGAYPALLLLGLLAAGIELVRRPSPAPMLLAAALVADVAAAPLYSNYVIPRYLLAGVFACWILVPRTLLAMSAAARKDLPCRIRPCQAPP